MMTLKRIQTVGTRNSPSIDSDFIENIISRSEPVEDRDDLRQFLTNVRLFIKRVDGFDLTEEEKEYPAHPQFSHLTFRKGKNTAEGLKARLRTIDRYQITNVQQIINIIASTAVSSQMESLTLRQIRLIEELHKKPLAAQYELAERLFTTSQVIRQELTQLRQNFSLAVLYDFDCHKFRLNSYEIDFRTKSLDASQELETYFRRTQPTFLQRLNFDHNYRDGFFYYFIPDQPSGQRMFAERVEWLNSNFLEDLSIFQVHSFQIDISFENYNHLTGTWMLNADTFSAGMLQFLSHQERSQLPPRGMIFGDFNRFDRIDFIIVSTAYVFGKKRYTDICQKVLERHGYSLSRKTIWNRLKKLYQMGTIYPLLWYDIPDFEELVKFSIICTPEAIEPIYRLISILPYTYSLRTDVGITFTFQRPSRCTSITGLLVETFDQIEGVSNIKIIRYEPTFSPQLSTKTADRWDESRQRWLPQKGDI
ncbi:MAG: hypothetical protein ACFFCF_01500 [Promethearchaeota archaeon]